MRQNPENPEKPKIGGKMVQKSTKIEKLSKKVEKKDSSNLFIAIRQRRLSHRKPRNKSMLLTILYSNFQK